MRRLRRKKEREEETAMPFDRRAIGNAKSGEHPTDA